MGECAVGLIFVLGVSTLFLWMIWAGLRVFSRKKQDCFFCKDANPHLYIHASKQYKEAHRTCPVCKQIPSP